MNIQSLLANFEQLETLIEIYNPSIVMLSETRVTEEINQCEIAVTGYSIVRCDSHSRHTGGVIMYIKNGVKFMNIGHVILHKSAWLLSVKISKGFSKGVYTVIYHSPSASDSAFLEFFESWCEETINAQDIHTIIGDFNIDISKESTYSKRLKHLISHNGMQQLVDTYTRVNENSQTIIDLVITNALNVSVNTLDCKIADHETLQVIFTEKICNDTVQQKVITDKTAYTANNFRNQLGQHNWNEVEMLDLNDKTAILVEAMQVCYNKQISKKTINVIYQNPWFSTKLKNLQQQRNALYKTAKRSNNADDWNNYKNIKNQYNRTLKMSKNEYYQKQIDSVKDSSKQMWKKLKQLIKNDTVSKAEFVEFENIKLTKPKEIAEQFNNYFVDSVKEIHESID